MTCSPYCLVLEEASSSADEARARIQQAIRFADDEGLPTDELTDVVGALRLAFRSIHAHYLQATPLTCVADPDSVAPCTKPPGSPR